MSALSGISILSGCAPSAERTIHSTLSDDPRRLSLRIAPVKLEISPKQIIQTIGYNGMTPGPLLRVKEGQQVVVNVQNDTEVPELVHWHGLYVSSEADGAMEEGTPLIAPGATRQYSFTARPSGTRWLVG
ncbi:MAG TPA: multicopper oxidase domain-containing protein [Candidatus Binatia bacterium]